MRWMTFSIVVAASMPVASLAVAQSESQPRASAEMARDLDFFPHTNSPLA